MSDRKSWSDRWFQLFLAFVVALVVAVCGPLVLSWAAPRFEAVFREPTCDDPRGLVPVSVKAPGMGRRRECPPKTRRRWTVILRRK